MQFVKTIANIFPRATSPIPRLNKLRLLIKLKNSDMFIEDEKLDLFHFVFEYLLHSMKIDRERRAQHRAKQQREVEKI